MTERGNKIAGVSMLPILLSTTADGEQATAWRASWDGPRPPEWDSHALEAWENAREALRRSAAIYLPWLDVHTAHQISVTPKGVWVSAQRRSVAREVGGRAKLDGASFGGAFALIGLGASLDLEPELRVAVSATLGVDGTLGPVDGLEPKLRALKHYSRAADLRRAQALVVARENHEEAERLVAELGVEVSVESFSTLDSLLHFAFGDYEERWIHRVLEGGQLDSYARMIFDVSKRSRKDIPVWTPVQRSASLLRERGGDHLDSLACIRLRHVEDVSIRHEGRTPESPLSEAEMGELVDHSDYRTIKLRLMRQFVQQASDTGFPGDRWLQERIAALSVPPTESAWSNEEARTAGAVARYHFVRKGSLVEARRLAVAATRYWFECKPGEASQPLSLAWLILGAALDEDEVPEQFMELERMSQDENFLGHRGVGGAYVRVARARAHILVGLSDEGLLRGLAQVAQRLELPLHLRFQALRWAILGARLDADEIQAALQPLRDGLQSERADDQHHAASNLAALGLHLAVRGQPLPTRALLGDWQGMGTWTPPAGNEPFDAAAALELFRAVRPGLMKGMEAHVPAGELAAFVDARFPY